MIAVVQPLSRVRLFDSMDCTTPGLPVHHQLQELTQTHVSFTISWSLLKLMSFELVMPSNHLILCSPLLLPPSIFPASGSFPVSQVFASGGQSLGASASASVLPVNIQGWFPLGGTGWIFWQSKGLSRVLMIVPLLCFSLHFASWNFNLLGFRDFQKKKKRNSTASLSIWLLYWIVDQFHMCVCLRVCVFVASFPFCLSLCEVLLMSETLAVFLRLLLTIVLGVVLPPFLFNKSWKFLFYGLLPQRMMPGASWKRKDVWQVIYSLWVGRFWNILIPLLHLLMAWLGSYCFEYFFFSEFWRHLSSVFLLPVISFISFLLCLICVLFFSPKTF